MPDTHLRYIIRAVTLANPSLFSLSRAAGFDFRDHATGALESHGRRLYFYSIEAGGLAGIGARARGFALKRAAAGGGGGPLLGWLRAKSWGRGEG